MYRAVDETGLVVDVLFREHRDTESAKAFFRQTLARTRWRPTLVTISPTSRLFRRSPDSHPSSSSRPALLLARTRAYST